MGWFDEQIRQRILSDNEQLSDALAEVTYSIVGAGSALAGEKRKMQAALDEISDYFHIAKREIPKDITQIDDQLDFLLRPSGIMRRTVRLTTGWYKDCGGVMLAQKKNGTFCALIPGFARGYSYFDYDTGRKVRVDARTAEEIQDEALCFYRPLPQKKLTVMDLIKFILSGYSVGDFVLMGIITLMVTGITMITPAINSAIFGTIIPQKLSGLIAPLACLFIGVTVSTMLMNIVRSTVNQRITMKTSMQVETAAMMRVLSLPADFFRKYSTGQLMTRLGCMNDVCAMLSDAFISAGFTGLFSLLYIGQIFAYAPKLLIPALCVIFATLVFSVLSAFVQMKVNERMMESSASESGMLFSFISGVQKIRLAGAEKRAFSKWAKVYSEASKLRYDPPALVKYSGVIGVVIAEIGIVVIYFIAASNSVSQAEFMAFNTAYGLVSGAFAALAGAIATVATIRPSLNMVKPILEAVPEIAENKRNVSSLHGGIELNHVSFRYKEGGPLIVNDLSLKIRPGQYVAIVGRTGCGKSTLIRLLLGFEKPEKGAIYYDGKDINQLDLTSLRRNIGVVLQNGKLFPGDIYSNITISAPWLTVNDAWEAAKLAGIEEDIRNMPMGMNTLISAETGGVSGGQAQRLMIARAIAPKPRVLIFDEATSALDNITQKQVTESLDSLKCTRIVVAHRLSTIRSCNRIIVLDGGRIIQDGTYEELMADTDGMFRALVARQQLNTTAAAAGGAQ